MKFVKLSYTWAAAILLICLTAGCQENGSLVGIVPGLGKAAPQTPTPFRPVLPTETPTPTYPPTATFTPTVTYVATATSTSTPTHTTTPVPCSAEQGRMEVFKAADSGAPLDFRIYLPPCYGMLPDTVYPVLYMIHGQTYNDDQWDRLGLDEAAEELIKGKEAAPFLIVMPLEVNTYADIYAHPFGSIIAEQLVPFIDQNYATCAERDCRAIGGLSRGGAWALHTGFDDWETFGAIGAHSTPPFIGDDTWLPIWLADIPEGQLPRVYLDAGDRDWFLQYTLAYLNLLDYYEVPHEWAPGAGAHDEEYWSAHTADYLRWYAQPWNERIKKLP